MAALLLSCLASAVAAEPTTVLATTYHRTFSAAHPVLKRIRPGELVATKTIDSGGRDETGEQRSEGGNPLTGPFFVEGAEPGDALLVHFKQVRINRAWGTTSARLGMFALTPESIAALHPMYAPNYMPDKVTPGKSNRLKWEVDLERGVVRLTDPKSAVAKLEFPIKPMLGCVGVAPAGDFAPTSTPAGSYGGNLDYNQIGEGAIVMLPVYHPGALLFIGDGHALQGDGEPTGNGVEISMDVQFTTTLKKAANLTGPRVETSDFIISVGSQPEFVSSLDRSIKLATSDMSTWLIDEYKMEPWAAHMLIGFQGKYDVVTVAGSMGLRIPKKYLPARPQ
ncbi:MAG: acetamidase [Opitutus sp.]|nr:acetamidase [Opitutus sp.]